MDLMELDTPTTVINNPFPETDYKKGKLRLVRGRVLKKLLKYEWKASLPALIISGIVLFAMTLFVCLFGNLDFFLTDEPVEYPATAVMSGVLLVCFYIFTILGVLVTPFGVALNKYHKNFFKDEGYLTFSIPASMEEHVLAKHLNGVITALIAMATSALSVALVVAFCGGGDLGYIEITPTIPQHPLLKILSAIEEIILFAEGIVGVFCVFGALECWGQKFKKKRQIFWRVFFAYIAFIVIETLFTLAVETGMLDFFYTTVAGGHIATWLTILLYAGVIAFSVWYELRTLKKKLNLK